MSDRFSRQDPLIVKAARAFDELEYAWSDFGEVAQKMGVPERDMRDRFGSEKGLVYAIIDAQHRLTIDQAQSILAKGYPAFETIIRITADFSRALIENTLVRAGLQLDCNVMMSDSLKAAWAEWEKLLANLFARAIKEGDLEQDSDAMLLSHNLNAFYFGIQFRSWRGSKYKDLMDELFQMWTIIIKSSFNEEQRIPFFGLAHKIILGVG